MASIIDIWSLYKFRLDDNTEDYTLIRTFQPSYPNWSQTQENFAGGIESQKREYLLKIAFRLKGQAYMKKFSFIGEFHGQPESEILYSQKGLFQVNIFYAPTKYGHPWIILDNTRNEESFLKHFKSEEYEKDYGTVEIIEKPIQVEATLITENDFDLSSIKHFDLKDTRPLFNE